MDQGAPQENAAKCFSCGAQLQLPDGPVGRMATCDSCDADVRCCRNCKFYDQAAYNECREPSAERVVDKDRANFCDYFTVGADPGSDANGAKLDALKKLDDLFK